ncbi:tail sheath [Halorubrum sodomense tailed virus 2]|uniref:Tail sheath n=1 Tax=Halorubrum sodomense tailed virus 2 TaxID=1262527 RepID=L7TGJ9_9CAUD|nr:tail sheath [Halorubrum sodomense tailed virus 2]AGC34289.1 tail sheath [Halorubrum sodomense tailed virus 2]
MANTYGDNTEPGIITEETSANNISRSGTAPSDLCIVGQADLANANSPASPNTVYEVTRDITAVEWFGPEESSLLTTAIVDALREGAQPVYAVAPSATEVVGEDRSSDGSTTISLDNAPLSENADDITVTLDGTEQTVSIVYDDVSGYSPAADEAYVNPVEGHIEVSTDTYTSLDVDYTHYDYAAGLDEVETNLEAAEAIDFLTAISENAAVQQDVRDTAESMSTEHNYTVALVAPNAARIDPDTYEQTYDSSRVQSVYPTRFADNTSALAAYAGKRADLGVSRTPIGQSLTTDKRLAVRLTRAERGNLIEQRVVPLENRAAGAVIKDDPTTVDTINNTEEAHINYGFKRLVLDYVYNTSRENEKPFIGRLNQRHVRNALADLISGELTALRQSNVIEGFSVRIYEESATKARLELNITAPDPLRFIENDVTVGSSSA